MEETNYVTNDTTVSSTKYLEPDGSPEEKDHTVAEVAASSPASIRAAYKRTTYLDKIKLWRSRDVSRPNRLIGMATRPLLFFKYPIVVYAGFSYGAGVIWFNVLINTASPYLGAAPYNFTAAQVGLSYIAVLLGTLLAFPLCGTLGDRFCLIMARRAKGIAEPEHRLWLNLLPLVLIPFSLILWGVGSAHGIPDGFFVFFYFFTQAYFFHHTGFFVYHGYFGTLVHLNSTFLEVS